MEWTVIGYRSGKFTDKATGKEISFGKLYVTGEDEHVTGTVCEAVKVPPEQLNGITLGDTVEIFYNKYQKAEKVVVI